MGPNQDKPLRLLYVILVFLNPPEPLETPYFDTDLSNMCAR
jgi:hypothetical protein